jgi:outer membrane protein assembly factor BamB/tetratricopeptide (TPR) repeat protein
MPPIFCPTCDTLVLDQPACPTCGWRRPRAAVDAGKEIWRMELEHKLPRAQGSAAIAGGRYCVSAEDGAIVALDAETGQVVWEQALNAHHRHALATDTQRILVSPVDIQAIPVAGTTFLALDTASGATLWQYPTAAHSLSAAAIDGTTAYFTSSDGQIHAVDVATGQPRWAARHGVWAADAPAAAGGIVCAGGRDTTLIGYAAEDGAQLWRFGAEGLFAGPLRVVDGGVYACCWDGCLYALERTGRLRWRLKPERGEGISSAPAVAGDRVFIGSRVYQDVAARAGNGYALLALRAEDGSELWRFETTRHITAPPAVAGNLVLFGADDGTFYALDATKGEECWQLKLDARVVTPPQIAGDVLYIGTRGGVIYAIRWRAQPAETLEDPQVYQQRGQPEQAAVAYALRGDLEAAAAIYERDLAQPRRAAQLYEHAGQYEPAARLWEQAGEPRRARDLYQEARRFLDVARLLADAGELLQAARLYEEQAEFGRAAALYEQAGDRGKAAELYHNAGQIEQAQRIWQSLGEWERLTDALIEDRQFAAAADLLAQHDQIERAAELYERAEQLAPALELRIALQHWERVADLAARIGDALNEAIAHEHLGNTLAAAQAYERAAEQARSADPTAEEHAATLYEQAAQLYDAVLADEDMARCRQLVKQLRRLPEISVSGGAQGSFVEHEWNTLNLLVKNTGYGPAFQITIAFDDDYDIEGSPVIARLLPGRSSSLEIYLRPQHGHYGPKVPFKITVTFEDRNGGQYATTQRMPLRVLPKGSAAEPQTPLEIDIRSEGLPEVTTSANTGGASLEDIEHQQALLRIHRRNLAHYLEQQARFGEALVPVNIVNGIEEEQANIGRIKAILRGWGVTVEDHPNDTLTS